MFLHCDGWKQRQQTDSRMYSDNGTLNYANRYDIKERTHNALDKRYSHNDTQIFSRFVELVDSQVTDVNLFDAEIKYLHDNGFKVTTMSDIGYDENTKYMYIKK